MNRKGNYSTILEHETELTPLRDMQVLALSSVVKFKRVHVIGEEIILSDQSNGTISGMRPRGGLSRRRDGGATPPLKFKRISNMAEMEFKNKLRRRILLSDAAALRV